MWEKCLFFDLWAVVILVINHKVSENTSVGFHTHGALALNDPTFVEDAFVLDGFSSFNILPLGKHDEACAKVLEAPF